MKYASDEEPRAAQRESDCRYREANPEKTAEQRRRYVETNREKIAEQRRRYREANPEKTAEVQRRYREADPEKIAEQRRRRRGRIAATIDRAHGIDVVKAYAAQEGLCYYCGKPLGEDFHRDHFYPVIAGGPDSWKNIRISCPKCNLKKGAKEPHDVLGGRLFPVVSP